MNATDILTARRYAEALFQIVRPMKRDEEIEAALVALSEALKSAPELERFFANPAVRAEEKRSLFVKVYGQKIDRVFTDFIGLLFQKNRFGLIHPIAVVFKDIADEAQGQADAEVRTAVPLAAQAEKDIVSSLEKMTGQKITLRKTVDASLIGGALVKIRNRVFDGTLKGKIARLRTELTKTRIV